MAAGCKIVFAVGVVGYQLRGHGRVSVLEIGIPAPSFLALKLDREETVPIYEYQCKSCGHEMEAFQRLSDDPLKECPSCGDLELTKLVSAAGFRLKGGGWYETDFKTGKDKKKNLAGEASSTATSSQSDSGSGAKSEGSKSSTPASS
jgi:putative FmdB family regulatory protein